jgi:RNA recognition motif-containing protein
LPTKDFDEKKLTEMFSKCGTITSVHLSVTRRPRSSRGPPS